jgi:hypothetical protein
VLPSVICPDTQEGVIFNGVVPDQKTLVIDAAEGATLDGKPVDEWVTYFHGGIADYSFFSGADFVIGEESTEQPFEGEVESLEAPPYQARRSVPTIRIGSTTWLFNVARGVYDGSAWDFAVCDTPVLPVGVCDGDLSYDQCVYSFDPSGAAGMAWDDRVTCAFKLLLPAKMPVAAPPKGGDKPPNYVGRIGTILPRFKAAGVRAYVDLAPDSWVLSESVLRDSTASSGEGVEFHSVIVRNQTMELLVP